MTTTTPAASTPSASLSFRAWAFGSTIEVALVVGSLCVLGCAEPAEPLPDLTDPPSEPEMPADAAPSGRVVHAMDPFELAGSQETMTCYSWTVGNDAPLYVNAVNFQNGGSFHHSNWFVVPEDAYPGEDGFWPCDERSFNDASAALSGTVLFAQSTQAQRERMAFAEGGVIRIPARSKIVGGVHLLNLGPDPRDTAGWFGLDVIHPGLVEATLSPIMLSYFDLDIPAQSRAEFVGECTDDAIRDLGSLELYYALPHYHGTGVTARLSLFEDGREIVALDHDGFGASAMGRRFDPPLEIDNLGGLIFSCGYDNPHDEALTWGIGINEMCVFLAFARADSVIVGGVEDSDVTPFEVEDGTLVSTAGCRTLATRRGRAYERPTWQEIEGPLVLPPTAEEAPPEPPTCEDIVDPPAAAMPTFDEVQARVLQPWCSFSSCHGAGSAGGLSLTGPGAYDALVEAASSVGDLPRVARGDPTGSSLYRLLAECEPRLGDTVVRHMPAGAPTLLDPELVGLVRTWIETGAPR